MKNQNQYQQGDVIFRRVNIKTTGKPVKRKNGRLVLADGETTGHAHVIEDSDAVLIQEGERMLLGLIKETIVTHEEHNPVTLPPGIWEVDRVREFDYMEQMSRRVQD